MMLFFWQRWSRLLTDTDFIDFEGLKCRFVCSGELLNLMDETFLFGEGENSWCLRLLMVDGVMSLFLRSFESGVFLLGVVIGVRTLFTDFTGECDE